MLKLALALLAAGTITGGHHHPKRHRHHQPACHTYIVPMLKGTPGHMHRVWGREQICGNTVTVFTARWS